MKGIFVSPDDEISIVVFIATNKTGEILASDITSDLMEKIDGLTEDKIEKVTAVFRKPSFKDSTYVTSSLIKTDQDYKVSMNPGEARIILMSRLIKSWNLKDENGIDVPATKENIEKLSTSIAVAIAAQLEIAAGQLF